MDCFKKKISDWFIQILKEICFCKVNVNVRQQF
jgi:hypothetical protein